MEFTKKEAELRAALSGVQTKQYIDIADEVKNDILLTNKLSLDRIRKMLITNRKKLTLKNSNTNNRKKANIDTILSVIDSRYPVSPILIRKTSPSKQTKKASPKAKLSPSPSPSPKPKPKEKVVKLINVSGDGNCFYRALWGAAATHPEGNLTGTIVQMFTGQPTGPVTEDVFISLIRNATADKIRNGIYNEINEAAKANIRANATFETEAGRKKALNNQHSFFEDLRQSAFAPEGERFLFEYWISESSDEIQREFSHKNFTAKYKTQADSAKFYRDLANIIGQSTVYASVKRCRCSKVCP